MTYMVLEGDLVPVSTTLVTLHYTNSEIKSDACTIFFVFKKCQCCLNPVCHVETACMQK